MPWSPADLADAITAGLQRRAAQEDAAQVVHGFDALDELGLHPLIREALGEAGYGVWPEQRYPGDRRRSKRTEGKRCDIVLTEDGSPLSDPLAKDTLFDALSPATDPQAAYWLEIKTVAQFETTGPFRRYGSELLQPVAHDVKKLGSDPVIRHGGLALVLFTQSREVADHDLLAWHTHCLDRGYPLALPAVRGFALNDRIGNAWCAPAVFAVRG